MASKLLGTGERCARSKSATVDVATEALRPSSCWDQPKRARAARDWAGEMGVCVGSSVIILII